MLAKRLEAAFAGVEQLTDEDLFARIQDLSICLDDVLPYLEDPGDKPYGRRPLYTNDVIEVIVMNWSTDLQCLPHNHGKSSGWVVVLSGAVRNTVFLNSSGEVPVVREKIVESAGSVLYAPAGLVHSMGPAGTDRPIVTLHFYTPPIHDMKVFDVDSQVACVVPDNCGAWWPEEPDPSHIVSLEKGKI